MRLKFETFCKIWLIVIFDAINKFIITYVFFIQTVVSQTRRDCLLEQRRYDQNGSESQAEREISNVGASHATTFLKNIKLNILRININYLNSVIFEI